mgnify:FL=1
MLQIQKKIAQVLKFTTVLVVTAFSTNLLPVSYAYATNNGNENSNQPDNSKVTICHRTNSVTNPYSKTPVDTSAIDGNLGNDNGQGDHYAEHLGAAFDENTTYPTPHNGDQWGDIIPPLPGVHTGLNWTTAGQAIYNNNCNVPETQVVQYMTVVWKVVDTNNNGDDWEQNLVGNIVTSTPNLAALDHLLVNTTCIRYQVDVYQYTSSADKAKVDNLIAGGVLYGPNNPPEPLIPGGAGVAYKLVGKKGVCAVTCPNPRAGGVITQTTPNWTIVGDAKFVDGALSISSDAWVDGGITMTGNYPLSTAETLDWSLDTSGVTGAHGVGIILETADGDFIHYEPGVYTDDFWSNTAVLPANGGGQGGPYSGSLQDALNTVGDVQIVSTTFVFTSADLNEDVELTSLSFNCTSYTFDKKEEKKADIVASAVCSANGVKVTLKNNGNDSGTANVNGQNYVLAAGETKEVIVPVDANYSATVKVTFDGKVIYDSTLVCNPGSGGGTPETPTTPQVLATSTTAPEALPATIPATGTAESRNPLMIVFAALAAYGAVYFLQGRVDFARKRS